MNTHVEHLTDSTFDAQVRESSVPVLVDYWAEWCAPCRMMGPVVDALEEEYAGKLKVVKVNTDENPGVSSRFHVRSIPTLMLFRDGLPVGTRTGALSKAQLGEFVDSVVGESLPA